MPCINSLTGLTEGIGPPPPLLHRPHRPFQICSVKGGLPLSGRTSLCLSTPTSCLNLQVMFLNCGARDSLMPPDTSKPESLQGQAQAPRLL